MNKQEGDNKLISLIKKIFPLNVLHRKILYRLYRDVLKRDVAMAPVLDFRMLLPIQTQGIGWALMTFGERELDQYNILGRVLRKNDTVMDIGGNIGYYPSIESRIVGPKGRIYCFEPDIRNLEILTANVEINGGKNITEIFNAPVSAEEKDVDFHLAQRSNLSSMELTRGNTSKSLRERNMQDRKYMKVVRLRTVSFCDFLSDIGRKIDLVRMDIEGHEATILTSLATRLESDKEFTYAPKYFVFEPHSWEYNEANNLASALTRLGKFGYKIIFLGTRDESKSPVGNLGHTPIFQKMEKRGYLRGVYAELPDQAEAIHLAANVDGVTTVCLERS